MKYFAGFYATGWDISAHDRLPRQGAVPTPSLRDRVQEVEGQRRRLGHFINVVEFSSAGRSDDRGSTFDELGNCIAVLVE